MSEAEPSSRRVTDANTLKALAHPVRLALLDALRQEGELTASRAGELLGESPGNMSWHLQTLAKYGFVEEAGNGKGRRRPWRAVPRGIRYDSAGLDPESRAAGEALEQALIARSTEQFQVWLRARHNFPAEWVSAAYLTDSVQYLTVEELQQVSEELQEIYTRYNDRRAPDPEAGTVAVRLSAHGHPLA